MQLPRPRYSPWRDLVLAVSLLAYGICQASGQISINPFIGLEGIPSFLELKNVPEGVQEYSWHRGTNDHAENMIVSYQPPSNSCRLGPMFSGRENVTNTGTLEINDSMLNDTGNYTVRVNLVNDTQRATGWLEIHKLEDNPDLLVNATLVAENMDPVVAFCNTSATQVLWYLNYLQVSSNDQVTISPDRKTLIMHWVERYDKTIQCRINTHFGDLQTSKIVHLTVAYGPDRVTLRSESSVIIDNLSAEIGSQVQITCSSTSFPGSKYRWIHNGSFLSAEPSLKFPSLAWQQMGRYRCIVENPVTQLTLYKDIRIKTPWKMPVIRTDFYITGPLVVFFIVMTVLGGIYVCGILVYFLINRSSSRTSRGL